MREYQLKIKQPDWIYTISFLCQTFCCLKYIYFIFVNKGGVKFIKYFSPTNNFFVCFCICQVYFVEFIFILKQ